MKTAAALFSLLLLGLAQAASYSSVQEAVVDIPELSLLNDNIALADGLDVTDKLQDPSFIGTVFAPINAVLEPIKHQLGAYLDLPPSSYPDFFLSNDVLSTSVVSGKAYTLDDLVNLNGQMLTTLAGNMVNVTVKQGSAGSIVYINQAPITGAGITAGNSIIYELEGMVVPYQWQTLANGFQVALVPTSSADLAQGSTTTTTPVATSSGSITSGSTTVVPESGSPSSSSTSAMPESGSPSSSSTSAVPGSGSPSSSSTPAVPGSGSPSSSSTSAVPGSGSTTVVPEPGSTSSGSTLSGSTSPGSTPSGSISSGSTSSDSTPSSSTIVVPGSGSTSSGSTAVVPGSGSTSSGSTSPGSISPGSTSSGSTLPGSTTVVPEFGSTSSSSTSSGSTSSGSTTVVPGSGSTSSGSTTFISTSSGSTPSGSSQAAPVATAKSGTTAAKTHSSAASAAVGAALLVIPTLLAVLL